MKNDVVMISLFIISQGMIIFISSLLAIAKSIFTIEIQVGELALQKKEADLNALKARINPHFLLNTLNNIYARSLTENSKSAQSVLELSRLLQFTLYDTDRETIPLHRELEALEALAGLYRLRWGGQLQITFDLPDVDLIEQVELTPLMLFSLFENALKHSAMGQEAEAWINLSVHTQDKYLDFRISNSIAIRKHAGSDEYQGLGLRGLRLMLENRYGNDHRLDLSENDKQFDAHLKVPI